MPRSYHKASNFELWAAVDIQVSPWLEASSSRTVLRATKRFLGGGSVSLGVQVLGQRKVGGRGDQGLSLSFASYIK